MLERGNQPAEAGRRNGHIQIAFRNSKSQNTSRERQQRRRIEMYLQSGKRGKDGTSTGCEGITTVIWLHQEGSQEDPEYNSGL